MVPRVTYPILQRISEQEINSNLLHVIVIIDLEIFVYIIYFKLAIRCLVSFPPRGLSSRDSNKGGTNLLCMFALNQFIMLNSVCFNSFLWWIPIGLLDIVGYFPSCDLFPILQRISELELSFNFFLPYHKNINILLFTCGIMLWWFFDHFCL